MNEKQENGQNRFLICLPYTLAQEQNVPGPWGNPNNFDDDVHDPGGETQDGLTQREYDIWRKRNGLPTQDVRKISETEGLVIYKASYWLPNCPDLVPGLDLQFFDSSVNEGTTEATRILQWVLGLAVDGEWGPKTAAAVAAIHPEQCSQRIKTFTARREAVYKEMKGYQYFGTDWERRSAEIGAEALKMAQI